MGVKCDGKFLFMLLLIIELCVCIFVNVWKNFYFFGIKLGLFE